MVLAKVATEANTLNGDDHELQRLDPEPNFFKVVVGFLLEWGRVLCWADIKMGQSLDISFPKVQGCIDPVFVTNLYLILNSLFKSLTFYRPVEFLK